MPPFAALLRVPLRAAGLVAGTLLWYPPLVIGHLVLARLPRRRRAWSQAVFRRWCCLLLRVLGVRVEVAGTPPAPPFLLVANHLSSVDILLLGAVSGGAFVAKREIAGWPVVGHLCRLVGTVFVDREAKRDLVRASGEMEGALAAGSGVVLFPEGGIVDGDELQPFRPGLLAGAVATGRAVHWAALSYATPAGLPAAAESVVWVGPLMPHVRRLLALPAIRARVVFGDSPVAEPDRKRLATLLHREIAAALAGRATGR
jgi:1-acyl-sn-glycerol-3-phosphate acyltransferase